MELKREEKNADAAFEDKSTVTIPNTVFVATVIDHCIIFLCRTYTPDLYFVGIVTLLLGEFEFLQ